MHPKTEEKYTASVLLVDDEPDFLELLAVRLKNRGMNVVTAASGMDALLQIEKGSFDIVVLDLAMPGMDGIETMKRIKARKPHTETILLTGHATLKTGIEAMKSGAEDYLEKPVDLDLLMKKINDAQYKRIRELEKNSWDDVKKILKSRGW